jgi:membrane protein implicated in regulation of membrane protease activity
MTLAMLAAADAEARLEGWVWWAMLVACLLVVLLALVTLRRFLIRPMSHKPSDTSDAWAEAGRRLRVAPPPAKPGAESEDEGPP